MISWKYEWSKGPGCEPRVVKDQGESTSHARIAEDVMNILDKSMSC